jgi:hypothetical protein
MVQSALNKQYHQLDIKPSTHEPFIREGRKHLLFKPRVRKLLGFQKLINALNSLA